MARTTAVMAASPARRPGRGLRIAAAAVAGHGLLLWVLDAAKDFLPSVPDAIGTVLFWVLAVPALLLAQPFTGLFWRLGLMNAPGWFAWPKPLAFALAYAAWTVALLALAWALAAWRGKTEAEERQP